MKLLKTYEDLVDAERLSQRLRDKGVMTFISSKQSHSFNRFRTGALKVGVWAVLPQQYQDAKKLLINKKHQVKTPLSIKEVNELEIKAKESYSSGINRLGSSLLTGVLLLLLAVLFIYIIFGVISNA